MSCAIAMVALFFAFLAFVAVAVAAVVLRSRLNAAASWLYLRRCLIFSLPLAIGFAAFYIAFARDPLWPNQDMTDAQAIEYHAAYAQALHNSLTAAALTSLALLWFIYRAATTFRTMQRLPPTTIARLD